MSTSSASDAPVAAAPSDAASDAPLPETPRSEALAVAPSIATAAQASIELENVSLRFRVFADRNPVLKQVLLNKIMRRKYVASESEHFWLYRCLNLRFDHGERIGIVGSNGAGKSTLLKVIAGIYHPTTGTVSVRGKLAPLIELGAGFNPELSGLENIFLNGAFLGFSHDEMAKKVDPILDFAGLREFAKVPVKYYSSGMMLRLGFSIATDITPEILILDEIFAAGDADFRAKAQDRMNKLLDNSHIVVIVSHDMNLVQKICTRVIWIDHGIVVMDGDPGDVCGAYLSKRYPPGFRALTSKEQFAGRAIPPAITQTLQLKAAEKEKLSADLASLALLLNEVEPYQPLFGVPMEYKAKRPSADRAVAIATALDEKANLPKDFKLVDIGAGVGYFPFYFAQRGAIGHGIDHNPHNVAVAKAVQRINRLTATFEINQVTPGNAEQLCAGFDVALLLSVLPHMNAEHGMEYCQQLMSRLCATVPHVVVELATRDEPVSFWWRDALPEDPRTFFDTCENVTIKKLGGFGSHHSTVQRPMYLISQIKTAASGGRERSGPARAEKNSAPMVAEPEPSRAE
jgi:ABC-type polysaccharide/polyol phosphate transport system ATPase subunit